MTQPMNCITIASMGHPQHGKSTLLGYLALHFRGERNLNRLIDAIEAKVTELGRPELRYSLVFDLPKADFLFREEELQEKGPTRTQSRTPGFIGYRHGDKRVMFVDEPGHTQFLKFIVGPTASTDVAILVVDTIAFLDDYFKTIKEHGEDCFTRTIDTKRGKCIPYFLHLDRQLREKARRTRLKGKQSDRSRAGDRWIPKLSINLINYLALVEIFKIRNLIVATHQMDKDGVRFSEDIFDQACDAFRRMSSFLRPETELTFVPTSIVAQRREEHNVVTRSKLMSWYHGPTLVDLIGKAVHQAPGHSTESMPLRLQIDKHAFGRPKGKRGPSPPPRIFGRIDRGSLRKGDEILVLPLGLRATVADMQLRDESRFLASEPYWEKGRWNIDEAGPGSYVSLAITGRDVDRLFSKKRELQRVRWAGQMVSHPDNRPIVAKRFRVRLMIVPPWWFELDARSSRMAHGYCLSQCTIEHWEPGHGEAWWQNMTVDVACESEVAIDRYEGEGALGKIVIEKEKFMIAGGVVVAVPREDPK